MALAHEAPDEEQAEEQVLATSSAAAQQPYLRSQTGAGPHSQKTSGPNLEDLLRGTREECLLQEGCPELLAPQRQELLELQLEDLLELQLVEEALSSPHSICLVAGIGSLRHRQCRPSAPDVQRSPRPWPSPSRQPSPA